MRVRAEVPSGVGRVDEVGDPSKLKVRNLAPPLGGRFRGQYLEIAPHDRQAGPNFRSESVRNVVRAVRWLLAIPAGLGAGVLIWLAASVGLDAFGVEPPAWLFFLVMAYAYLAAGFVLAGTATKLAPARRPLVAVAMIGVALAIALVIVLRAEHGWGASLVFGLSLMAGAIGYSLRLRGFSEPLDAGA